MVTTMNIKSLVIIILSCELIKKKINMGFEKTRKRLKNILERLGFNFFIENVPIELIKEVYPNLSDLINDLGIPPYRISADGLGMYLNDLVVSYLSLEDTSKEKKIGDFTWLSGGFKYKFTAYLYPLGNGVWKVVGHSGDYGFGYSWISKRNMLGKRARMGIYNQIIEKYGLYEK